MRYFIQDDDHPDRIIATRPIHLDGPPDGMYETANCFCKIERIKTVCSKCECTIIYCGKCQYDLPSDCNGQCPSCNHFPRGLKCM